MKCILFLAFSLIFSAALVGQETECSISVKGRVLDIESSEPVAFATVQIAHTSIGTVTNEHGEFLIENLCPGEIDLEVSHVSYKPISHHHDLYHGDPIIFLALSDQELESIVVEEIRDKTALRSTSSKVESISDIDKLGTSAGDLVGRVSGVSTFRTGPNVVKPMIHGLHSNRVLIINNGIRHSYQAWGREHAPEIDAGATDQIKVVKGAGTVRYGPDALGGVILFDVERPSFDSNLGGSVMVTGESNGRAYSTNAKWGQGFHRFAWNAGVRTKNQGDLAAPDYMLTNTGAKEIGADLNLTLHRESFDVSLYVSHFGQELGILRGSVIGNLSDLIVGMREEPPRGTRTFSNEINNPRQVTAHSLYKLQTSVYFGEYELNAHYAFQRNLRQEFDVRRGTNNQRPAIDLELNSHEVDINLTFPSGKVDGMIGVQGYIQDNNNIPGTNTIPFVPNYNIMNLGIYTVQSLSKNQSTYEIGARYDFQYLDVRGRDSQNDIYSNVLNFNNTTFLLGYSTKLNSKWRFTSNLASAWRPPNVGELYSFGKHQFTVEYGIWRYDFGDEGIFTPADVLTQDDKSVKTEQGIKWINELSYSSEKLQSEIVLYWNHISNYFFQRPFGVTNTVRGAFPYFLWDQTDARFMGIDLDFRLQHSSTLESEIRAAYVHAEDIKTDQFFLEVPPLNVSYQLSRNVNRWSYGISLEYSARQAHTPKVISPEEILADNDVVDPGIYFDFREATRGFFLVGSNVSYESDKWLFSVAIDNMLNNSYRIYTDRLRYFADNPGVNVQLGAQFKF